MKYKITRLKKDKSEYKNLSKTKKSFVSKQSNNYCVMTEKEADDFIKQKGNDPKYYFVKTQI